MTLDTFGGALVGAGLLAIASPRMLQTDRVACIASKPAPTGSAVHNPCCSAGSSGFCCSSCASSTCTFCNCPASFQ
ncbi:hypothetical protein C7A07_15310 [Pseudomonas fragi]|nr:hypothetical protein [Pseudomonas fragi]PRW97703.1 hypothetical protein C7A07_15310 [Pseudomonas fragi]